MKMWGLVSLAGLSLIVSSCTKPDRVRTIKSPDPSIFLTVETQNGTGAISSDFTNAYVHFTRDGKTTKQVLINGEYLEDADFAWQKPNVIAICLHGGYTDEFHNEITLEIGSAFKNFHAFLKESCSLAAMRQ